MRHTFKQLKIWQLGMNIAKAIYEISAKFPSEEKFGLISQIRRCAVSIPSNIAEGSGRGSDKELKHFLEIALGSVYELETQLILSEKLEISNELNNNLIHEQISELEKMIVGFIKKIKMETEV